MDDALAQVKICLFNILNKLVLILVVMDDALALRFWYNNIAL